MHETFHQWIGKKIRSPEPEGFHKWFFEGFVEHMARRILAVISGLLAAFVVFMLFQGASGALNPPGPGLDQPLPVTVGRELNALPAGMPTQPKAPKGRKANGIEVTLVEKDARATAISFERFFGSTQVR